MAISIKKPILVAGVSLSFLLWIGESIKNSVQEVGDFSILALISVGGLWLFWQRKHKTTDVIIPKRSTINSQDLELKIKRINNLFNTLINEFDNVLTQKNSSINAITFDSKIKYIEQEKTRTNLKLEIISQNNINSENLSNSFKKKFGDNIDINFNNKIFNCDGNSDIEIKKISLNADLILMMIHGDITESEKQILAKISHNQKVFLLFNDVDYPLGEEKSLIFESIKNQVSGIIDSSLILKISTIPQKVKVKKYVDEINYQEWEEISPGDYQNLLTMIDITLEKEKDTLILATAYRHAIELETEIKTELNNCRKEKALPLIEKYQMIAATATFANPVSSLDLLATAAINTQMIVDLSGIYQHPLSLNQAKEVSIELAKVMVKLGIVEISSQAIAGILKSNAITFVAGGIIQGVSAAYLTRLCGLSLIAYYEVTEFTENQGINLNGIKEKITLIFQQTKDNNFLTKFVQKTALAFNQ